MRLFLLILAMGSASWARGDLVPSVIAQYAEAQRDHIVSLLREDPDLRRASGTEDALPARYDFSQAFHAYRIDSGAVAGARSISEAVVPQDVYYIPICLRRNCSVMAGFRWDEKNGAVEFVSAGHEIFVRELNERRRTLAQSGEADPETEIRVVVHEEAHGSYLFGRRRRANRSVICLQGAIGVALRG